MKNRGICEHYIKIIMREKNSVPLASASLMFFILFIQTLSLSRDGKIIMRREICIWSILSARKKTNEKKREEKTCQMVFRRIYAVTS